MGSELSIVDMQKVADYAWAAGIVDGEGHIGIHWVKRTVKGIDYENYQFYLSIGQASINGKPEILTRFKNIFSLGNIVGPYNYRNPKYKPLYRYQTYNEPARIILKLIWPYLGEIKRQQAISAGFKL